MSTPWAWPLALLLAAPACGGGAAQPTPAPAPPPPTLAEEEARFDEATAETARALRAHGLWATVPAAGPPAATPGTAPAASTRAPGSPAAATRPPAPAAPGAASDTIELGDGPPEAASATDVPLCHVSDGGPCPEGLCRPYLVMARTATRICRLVGNDDPRCKQRWETLARHTPFPGCSCRPDRGPAR